QGPWRGGAGSIDGVRQVQRNPAGPLGRLNIETHLAGQIGRLRDGSQEKPGGRRSADRKLGDATQYSLPCAASTARAEAVQVITEVRPAERRIRVLNKD